MLLAIDKRLKFLLGRKSLWKAIQQLRSFEKCFQGYSFESLILNHLWKKIDRVEFSRNLFCSRILEVLLFFEILVLSVEFPIHRYLNSFLDWVAFARIFIRRHIRHTSWTCCFCQWASQNRDCKKNISFEKLINDLRLIYYFMYLQLCFWMSFESI